MAVTSRSIKCTTCNVFTTNADYCKSCGALISHKKKQDLKAEDVKQEMIAEEKWKLDNPGWVERLKKHPFWLYKGIGYVLYSVIFVVSVIGSLLAWAIAMVAAG